MVTMFHVSKDNAGYNVSQRIMVVTMFHKG